MLGTLRCARLLIILPAATLTLGALTVGGCKKADDTMNPPSTSTPPVMPMPAPPTTPGSTPDATTQPTTPGITTPTVPSIPSTLPTLPDPTGPTTVPSTAPAADATGAATDSAKIQATGLMGQIQEAIKAKKWDDAQSLMTKLDALKDKLPADMQKQIDSLHTALTAEKASSGLKLPGLPGTGDNK